MKLSTSDMDHLKSATMLFSLIEHFAYYKTDFMFTLRDMDKQQTAKAVVFFQKILKNSKTKDKYPTS